MQDIEAHCKLKFWIFILLLFFVFDSLVSISNCFFVAEIRCLYICGINKPFWMLRQNSINWEISFVCLCFVVLFFSIPFRVLFVFVKFILANRQWKWNRFSFVYVQPTIIIMLKRFAIFPGSMDRRKTCK